MDWTFSGPSDEFLTQYLDMILMFGSRACYPVRHWYIYIYNEYIYIIYLSRYNITYEGKEEAQLRTDSYHSNRIHFVRCMRMIGQQWQWRTLQKVLCWLRIAFRFRQYIIKTYHCFEYIDHGQSFGINKNAFKMKSIEHTEWLYLNWFPSLCAVVVVIVYASQ